MNMTITESDKKLLSFLTAFLLAVLFIFLVFRPLSDKNKELEREIITTKDQEMAMDMSASLADDMVTKEKNTLDRMQMVLQRFYPMLQSQEAENMVTVLMLNHALKIQNLSVVMAEKPSRLNWYQYAEGAAETVAQSSTEESTEGAWEYGVYTARITCTAEGDREDMMALVDDISMNYPAISILGTEWSVIEKPVVTQVPVLPKEEEAAEDAEAEEAEQIPVQETVTVEQTGGMTITLEIYMCEQ